LRQLEDGVPAPRWVARFNKVATNRVTLPLAPHVPGFGVVEHVGRASGRHYRTPVNVFPRADGFVIALTYGSEAQWTRNVLANGGCALTTRGHTWRLTQPRLYRDEQRRAVPAPVRLILRLLGVTEFLDLSVATP
jgi:deazaflavin-dependent oxidoreductase (nitroreductase family)